MSGGLYLVTGASGYVGGRLVQELQSRGERVRCLARRPEYLQARFGDETEVVRGDVLDPESLPAAMAGVQVAYYLIHSMASAGNFESQDREAALRFAESAGRRRPAEPRVLGGAAQLLASLGEVDRAARCLADTPRSTSAVLPSRRWAELAIELGRGRSPGLPAGLADASSPWAPVLRARIALASGGIKALSAILRQLGGATAELAPFFALAGVEDSGKAVTDEGAVEPAWAYVKGLRAGLEGQPALAAELLVKALSEHADACRAAGEYLAACRELARAPDAQVFAWLARENAGCVNLPAATAAAAERHPRRARRR